MSYPYPKHRIDEIVASPKIRPETQPLRVEKHGEHGAKFQIVVDLLDGPYVDLRYLGKAAMLASPTSYDASLIVSAERVRGIGFAAVGRNNLRAKKRIPPGWHQNFCNPHLPTLDPERNRHESLPGFAPTDFGDFIHQCARLWVIDLATEEPLL
jgi:hypothetical protein